MIKSVLIALALTSSAATFVAPQGFAQTIIEQTQLPSGDFVRKSKRLQGSYEVIQRDGQTFIRFSDDFRAARGPDLKIFLSPKDVKTVTGKTAVDGSILLGELISTRGAQEYLVPEGVDLNEFGSVLVHCEEFAVLWGGSDL